MEQVTNRPCSPLCDSDEPSDLPYELYEVYENGDLEEYKLQFTRENVDERCYHGYSPLMWACTQGDGEIVMHLLGLGANVNHKDDRNSTPLHVASFHGYDYIVKNLLDNGAQVNPYTKMCVRCPGRSNHHTPLHFACSSKLWVIGDRNWGSVTRLLVEAGADVNARNGKGETPLHFCRNDAKKTKILLEAGAKVNVFDLTGKSPLHCLPSIGCIQLLLDFGADVNLVDSCGNTPLDYAVDDPNPITVSLLLTYLAGVNVPCHRDHHCGHTVFMCCWARCLLKSDMDSFTFLLRIDKLNDVMDRFSDFYVLAKVSGLAFRGEIPPVIGLNQFEEANLASQLRVTKEECEGELSQMSVVIGDSTVTYKDILYQREFALRNPLVKKALTLNRCKENFLLYGGLLHTRFVTGQRRVFLIDKCVRFFNLASPSLPSECLEIILSHLDNAGLRNLACACPTSGEKCASRKRSMISNNIEPPQNDSKQASIPLQKCSKPCTEEGTATSSLYISEKIAQSGGEPSQKLTNVSKIDVIPSQQGSHQGGKPPQKPCMPCSKISNKMTTAYSPHSTKQGGEPSRKPAEVSFSAGFPARRKTSSEALQDPR